MKDKYKQNEQPAGPTISKTANAKEMRASSKGSGSKAQGQQRGNAEDEKKYEVGIVEIASNLSDLSGSTGDAESEPGGVKQLSTKNADAKEFEILIQAKHAEACKAMGVRNVSDNSYVFDASDTLVIVSISSPKNFAFSLFRLYRMVYIPLLLKYLNLSYQISWPDLVESTSE